jgi:hypothetical protein
MSEHDRAVDDALAPLLETLALDGYEGSYEHADGTLKLRIVAGADACEDCLSPKEITTRIVQRSLEDAGVPMDVELRYPTD